MRQRQFQPVRGHAALHQSKAHGERGPERAPARGLADDLDPRCGISVSVRNCASRTTASGVSIADRD
jgi:hypothetical protein